MIVFLYVFVVFTNKGETADNIGVLTSTTKITVFRLVSYKCTEQCRYIAHFLIDHSAVERIFQDKKYDIIERIRSVLEFWYENAERETATWSKLRALLIFLGREDVVTVVESGRYHS